MYKKVFFFFLFGLFTTNLFAQNDPPENPGGRPHLIPEQRIFSITYNAEFHDFTLLFRRSIPQATLFIYKDGVLVDENVMTDIQAGSTTTHNLSFYGYGLFTIYIKIGEQTYAVFEEEIEEE